MHSLWGEGSQLLPLSSFLYSLYSYRKKKLACQALHRTAREVVVRQMPVSMFEWQATYNAVKHHVLKLRWFLSVLRGCLTQPLSVKTAEFSLWWVVLPDTCWQSNPGAKHGNLTEKIITPWCLLYFRGFSQEFCLCGIQRLSYTPPWTYEYSCKNHVKRDCFLCHQSKCWHYCSLYQIMVMYKIQIQHLSIPPIS